MIKYLKTLIIFACIVFSNDAISQPKIKIINPDIDFGEVKYSKETVVKRVDITNEGTDTLVINSVKPSCGCTVAEMMANKIAPGDTNFLVATLHLTNLSGKVNKSINIRSNDTSLGSSTINLFAIVLRPFEVTPKYITFEKVIVEKPTTTEILIQNNSNSDAVVKSVSFSNEGIICNLNENDVIKKGESFKLISTAIATQPGSIRCELKIDFFHPDEKSITILVYGNAIKD